MCARCIACRGRVVSKFSSFNFSKCSFKGLKAKGGGNVTDLSVKLCFLLKGLKD